MKHFIYIIAIFCMLTLSAEAKSLEGVVLGTDPDGDEKPLVGASLQWQGTRTGAFSQKDGKFDIIWPKGAHMLIVSMVGYRKDTIHIDENLEYKAIILESDLTMDKVEITGQQPSLLKEATIHNSETITGRGLRKAACCNLAESFQTNPSVDVNYSDAISGARQIELLGLAGKYSQFLVEKMPLVRGMSSMYGLSYIPGSWMQAIQISKGAATVSAGYESMSGQINVEYKKPHTSEFLHINGFANQMGRMELNLNNSYNVTSEIGTSLFAHVSQMQNEIDGNDDGFLDLPKTKQLNLMNRWNYRTDHNHFMVGVKGLIEERNGGQKGYEDDKANLYGLGIDTKHAEAFLKNGYIFDTHNYRSLAIILNATYHDQDAFFGHREYNGIQKSLYGNLLFEGSFESLNPFGGGHDDEHDGHEDAEHDGHEGEEHDGHEGDEQESHDEHGHEGHHHVDPPHKLSAGLSWIYDEYDEVFDGTDYDRIESVPGAFVEYTYKGQDMLMSAGIRADEHNKYGTFVSPRFHLKYDLTPATKLRLSGGKGYRTSQIYSENIGVMASSRQFIINDNLDAEEAWNYGINMTSDVELFGLLFNFGAEYYRTDFINQVVVDLEQSTGHAYFYNLDGESYSNAVQVDLSFSPFKRFVFTSAYRMVDVHTTINDELLEKPLISKHKGFVNLEYNTSGNQWQFDFTAVYNGSGRIPNTSGNIDKYRLAESFDGYFMFFSQITFNWDKWAFYLGSDNIGNFIQDTPVLAFDEPFGEYFDASMVWGPLHGRTFYAGFRFEIK